MPPGWWVPVRGSDPHDRKREVRAAVEERGGTLHCFWKVDEEGASGCYALIESIGDAFPADLGRKIGATGDATRIKRV